jgi:hypothetical protein
MNNLINAVSNNIEIIARSFSQIFWEIADEAQQTRSRLRLQKELERLTERETAQYQQLGHMGFELLQDRLAIERTPKTLRFLAEIDRLRDEQHRLRRRPDAKYLETPTPFPWHRLEKVLESGEWVIHTRTLPDSSPWCGRPMMTRSAAGVCFALKRGDSVLPVAPDTVCLSGDLLMILSPVGSVSAWDRWIVYGSSNTDEHEGR